MTSKDNRYHYPQYLTHDLLRDDLRFAVMSQLMHKERRKEMLMPLSQFLAHSNSLTIILE